MTSEFILFNPTVPGRQAPDLLDSWVISTKIGSGPEKLYDSLFQLPLNPIKLLVIL
jgi:hypothetical protein